METLKTLLSKLPKWAQAIVLIAATLIAAISFWVTQTGCSSVHTVTQTTINHRTKDTLTQSYIQVGRTVFKNE